MTIACDPEELLRPVLTRRSVLTGVLATTGVLCLEASRTPLREPPALVLIDARSASSQAFKHAFTCDWIDVSQEERIGWRRLRGWGGAGRVAGLTRWSEYLQARAVLEERGLRVRQEIRHDDLIRWEMA
jgi:hypothetical protein